MPTGHETSGISHDLAEDRIVATLCFLIRGRCHEKGHVPVRANGHFDIGRSTVQSVFGINLPCISKHHLRFHCVTYNDDAHVIAPMVYVAVISCNAVKLLRNGEGQYRGVETLKAGDRPSLLNHNDRLEMTSDVGLIFQVQADFLTLEDGLTETQRSESNMFSNQYLVSERKLGAGAQAAVFVAVKQSTKRQVACKIVPIFELSYSSDTHSASDDSAAKHLTPQQLLSKHKQLTREFNILKTLNHPNIIALDKVICTTYHAYIIQELYTGGDLMSYIEREHDRTEPQCAIIVRQLLEAVRYLHSNGIVHRDIKPENVVITQWRAGARVVLMDFGQAKIISSKGIAATASRVGRMHTLVGTKGYAAPEIVHPHLNQFGYNESVDIWAIGCLTTQLLIDSFPFPKEHCDEVHAASRCIIQRLDHANANVTDTEITNGPPHHTENQCDSLEIAISCKTGRCRMLRECHLMEMDCEGGPWEHVGRKAKSFVRGCLDLNESRRLTAQSALSHEWLTSKHYAADMEAAYQRSIQDWDPREREERFVEYIDTRREFAKNRQLEYPRKLANEVRSRYWSGAQNAPSHFLQIQVPIQHAPRPPEQPDSLPPCVRAGYEDTKMEDTTPPSAQQEVNDGISQPLEGSNSYKKQVVDPTAMSNNPTFSIYEFAPPQTPSVPPQPRPY